MEWKSSTDKEKYGDVVGEVIHHTLFEDGTISKSDVKFGNKTIKNIPTNRLSVVEQQEHMHAATEPDDEELEELIGALAGGALGAKMGGGLAGTLGGAALGHVAQKSLSDADEEPGDDEEKEEGSCS